MPVMQIAQKSRGIVDVLVRIEHLFGRGKILAMKVLVDLHAADVYELGATRFGGGELLKSSLFGRRKERFALNVQRVRV